MMELPPGTVDPIFLHQLALELHMTVRDIGERMSAHELCVQWPAFYRWRQKAQEREERRAEAERDRGH